MMEPYLRNLTSFNTSRDLTRVMTPLHKANTHEEQIKLQRLLVATNDHCNDFDYR